MKQWKPKIIYDTDRSMTAVTHPSVTPTWWDTWVLRTDTAWGVSDIIEKESLYKTLISELSHSKAQDAKNKFLFIEFERWETHASIIHTSTLSDGSEIYTVRFGIVELWSQRPIYNWLAVFRRGKNGNIQLQEPISKIAPPEDIPWSSEKEQEDPKKIYKIQLWKIADKIWFLHDQTGVLDGMRDSLILQKNGGKIYDISDPNNDTQKQFLIHMQFEWQQLECQFSIYKEWSRDVLEVHSLAREWKAWLDTMLAWITENAIPLVQESLQEKWLLTDLSNVDIFLTRDQRHDKVTGDWDDRQMPQEHQNRQSLLKWTRIIKSKKRREELRRAWYND